jgi:filamentous hemagglutinin family protein
MMMSLRWNIRPLARIPKSPLNPPELGDFESTSNSCSPQNWGARGARDDSRKRSIELRGLGIAIAGSTLGFICAPSNSFAQSIRLDGTLAPTRELAGPDYIIKQSDGRTAGQNLFHSFQKFNLNIGEKAIFESGAGIRNILSRVTGGSRSDINGLIKTSSGVNLFLINPSGILFGESAQLDVGGSFVATTSNRVKFGDQGFFDASIPNDPGLLTINPSALVFNQSTAQPIINHANTKVGERPDALSTSPKDLLGIKVADQKSLLLVGGDIILDKGGVNALGGRVELAAIAGQGQVDLDIKDNQLSLHVPENLALADILLKNDSIIDTSGGGAGDVRLYGKNIRLTDRSKILSQVYGDQPGGSIIIKASNSLALVGAKQGNGSFSELSTITASSGAAGDIEIWTKNLSIFDGANITSLSLTAATAGDVRINAGGTIEISGFSMFAGTDFKFPSIISSSNFGSGNGGSISISAQKLLLQDSSFIQTAGTAAEINGELILATGTSGNININVDVLRLEQGSALLASSSLGQASNISIRAREISLDQQSQISASAETNNIQSGGNVFILSNRLSLRNGSEIVAKADQGQGGNIIIQTQTLNQDASSSISADSERGTDGRVIINTFEFSPKNLSAALVDQTGKIAQTCVPKRVEDVNSFTISGRGGVPSDPSEPLAPETVWVEWATTKPAIAKSTNNAQLKSPLPSALRDAPALESQPSTKIVEAQGWIKNAKGEIYLVAAASSYYGAVSLPLHC